MTTAAAIPTTAQDRLPFTGPQVAPAHYLRIDDQFFDVAALIDARGQIKSLPQGATVDSDAVTWNMKYNGWEAGVIPIEFAADVSQTHRDQFMRVCNTGWGSAAYVTCVPHTSQTGFLRVSQLENEPDSPSPCHSAIGQARRLVLNERLGGGSPTLAWTRIVNAIQGSAEWKSKHGR